MRKPYYVYQQVAREVFNKPAKGARRVGKSPALAAPYGKSTKAPARPEPHEASPLSLLDLLERGSVVGLWSRRSWRARMSASLSGQPVAHRCFQNDKTLEMLPANCTVVPDGSEPPKRRAKLPRHVVEALDAAQEVVDDYRNRFDRNDRDEGRPLLHGPCDTAVLRLIAALKQLGQV